MLTGAQQRAFVRGLGGVFAGAMGGFFGVGRNPANGFSVGIHEGSIPSQVAHNVGTVFGGGLRTGASVFGHGVAGAFGGIGLGAKATGGYLGWRKEEQAFERAKRAYVDNPLSGRSRHLIENTKEANKFGDLKGYAKQTSKYRKGLRWADPAHNQRSFAARSASGHLNKMGRNLVFMGPLTPTSLGINSLIAGVASGDDIFDIKTGIPHHFAAGVAGEIGAMTGMGFGAALAKKMVPSGALAPAIGAAGGLMIGAMAGMAAIEAVHEISAFGDRHGRFARTRKSTFQDSEAAMTMRQRAMDSVYKSQFNARSAFGQEALAYHS